MRSSILLLGSMLGGVNGSRIGYPGGCTIGARPVNLHLEAMKKRERRSGRRRERSVGNVRGTFRRTYPFPDFQCGSYGKCTPCGRYSERGNASGKLCPGTRDSASLLFFTGDGGGDPGNRHRKDLDAESCGTAGCGIYDPVRPDRCGNLSVCGGSEPAGRSV